MIGFTPDGRQVLLREGDTLSVIELEGAGGERAIEVDGLRAFAAFEHELWTVAGAHPSLVRRSLAGDPLGVALALPPGNRLVAAPFGDPAALWLGGDRPVEVLRSGDGLAAAPFAAPAAPAATLEPPGGFAVPISPGRRLELCGGAFVLRHGGGEQPLPAAGPSAGARLLDGAALLEERSVAVLIERDGAQTLLVLSTRDGAIQQRLPVEGVTRACFAPRRGHVVLLHGERRLAIVDLRFGKTLKTWEEPLPLTDFGVDAGAHHLVLQRASASGETETFHASYTEILGTTLRRSRTGSEGIGSDEMESVGKEPRGRLREPAGPAPPAIGADEAISDEDHAPERPAIAVAVASGARAPAALRSEDAAGPPGAGARARRANTRSSSPDRRGPAPWTRPGTTTRAARTARTARTGRASTRPEAGEGERAAAVSGGTGATTAGEPPATATPAASGAGRAASPAPPTRALRWTTRSDEAASGASVPPAADVMPGSAPRSETTAGEVPTARPAARPSAPGSHARPGAVGGAGGNSRPRVDEARVRNRERRLAEFATRFDPLRDLGEVVLPAAVERALDLLAARERVLAAGASQATGILPGVRSTVALFEGPRGSGKSTAAAVLARALGRVLFRVSGPLLVAGSGEAIARRLARLSDVAAEGGTVLLFEDLAWAWAASTPAAGRAMPALVERFVDDLEGLALFEEVEATRLPPALERRAAARVAFAPLAAADAARLLRALLPADARALATEAVRCAGLTPRAIRRAVELALLLATDEGTPLAADHLARALAVARP